MGKETLKVGIIGCRDYENRQKIKKFIFKLKNEKGVDTIIVGNGKYNVGNYIKKYALEFGLQYQEVLNLYMLHLQLIMLRNSEKKHSL